MGDGVGTETYLPYWPWPAPGTPGTFRVRCGCRKWEFEGTAEEIRQAARGHDDAPWMNHMVTFGGKVS